LAVVRRRIGTKANAFNERNEIPKRNVVESAMPLWSEGKLDEKETTTVRCSSKKLKRERVREGEEGDEEGDRPWGRGGPGN
jgi:hypothetical protein